MRRTRDLAVLAAAIVVLGLGMFGTMVWRAVESEPADHAAARAAFAQARERWDGQAPMVRIGPGGEVVRGAAAGPDPGGELGELRVLAWWPDDGRLVRAEVPYWFLALKGPAVDLALSRTGLDLDALGLRVADLRRFGPGLILDEPDVGGVALLVWQR